MIRVRVLTTIAIVLFASGTVFAGTAFTYQGDLKENGQAANGAFDMAFSLWNAVSGGNQIGSTVVINGVQVTGGLFTVEVDFGADAFDNSDRWLQIAVSGITLTPRQPITRAPYAIQTRGIFVNNAGKVGIGTSSPANALHVVGGTGAFTNLANGVHIGEDQFGSTHIELVDGNGQTPYIDFIESNTRDSDARINLLNGRLVVSSQGELSLQAGADLLLGNLAGTTVTLQQNGNVGIGTSTPGFLLEVNGSAGKPGGGSWSNSSDARLKKDVEDLDGALNRLLALRGVRYEYKDPKAINELEGERIGMIAQEVEKVFPDWVEVHGDGFKTVTFRGFEALTVEALRDLRNEQTRAIDALRSEKDSEIRAIQCTVDEQRQLIAELLARVEALEASE